MKISHIYYSERFKKSLEKFDPSRQERIRGRLELFIEDPFNPQLRTHKLSGKLKNYWSFSITY